MAFARLASPCSSLPTLPGEASAVLASSPGGGYCFRFLIEISQASIRTHKHTKMWPTSEDMLGISSRLSARNCRRYNYLLGNPPDVLCFPFAFLCYLLFFFFFLSFSRFLVFRFPSYEHCCTFSSLYPQKLVFIFFVFFVFFCSFFRFFVTSDERGLG